MKAFIILAPYIVIFFIVFKFLKKMGLFTVTNIGKEFYSGVATYEEIQHTSRLGGLVRNPNTGKLQLYNSEHPLWVKKYK